MVHTRGQQAGAVSPANPGSSAAAGDSVAFQATNVASSGLKNGSNMHTQSLHLSGTSASGSPTSGSAAGGRLASGSAAGGSAAGGNAARPVVLERPAHWHPTLGVHLLRRSVP